MKKKAGHRPPAAKHPEMQTVLVAEDNQIIRRMVSEMLRDEGFRVLAAENGRQALELCNQQIQVDLLVTDINMPKMGGLELIECLAKQYPKLKVICMSGEHLGKKLPPIVLQFLQKPLKAEQFASAVRKALGKKQ